MTDDVRQASSDKTAIRPFSPAKVNTGAPARGPLLLTMGGWRAVTDECLAWLAKQGR